MVELRADLMGLSPEQIGRLCGVAPKTIVTCHLADPAKAEAYYNAAIRQGAWAIDVALERGAEQIKRLATRAKSAGCKLILSQHYATTPPFDTLLQVAGEMFAQGCDIAKIITTATSTAEAIVPIGLYRWAEEYAPERIVAFAMGEAGSFTRRLSLLMGAPYTYVALDTAHRVAIGQPTEADMRATFESKYPLEGLMLPTSITPPCSKSEAQRAILCAALASGKSIIEGYTPCDDNEAALAVAKELGAKISLCAGRLTIVGLGHKEIARRLKEATNCTFHVGESALTARLTRSVVAALGIEGATFATEGTLRHRDMNATNEAIATMARGSHWELDGSSSSQHISGAMMAAALLDSPTTIVVNRPTSRPYITLTANIMRRFGAQVGIAEGAESIKIYIEGGGYAPAHIALEGDWSSAAYFAAAYAIAQSGYLRAERYTLHIDPNKASQQADKSILEVLRRAGANITIGKGVVEFLPSKELRGFDYDASDTPDLLPTLAVVALFATSASRIGGLGRLANKESNRTEAIVEALLALGGDVHIEGNELVINGGRPLHSAPLRCHSDHRMAMSLAVAALFMEQAPTIDNIECVAKSYPTFFTELNKRK